MTRNKMLTNLPERNWDGSWNDRRVRVRVRFEDGSID